MSLTLSLISIDGNDYPAFATVAMADAYLAVEPLAVAWRALETADEKGGYLVSATRVLMRQPWQDGVLADPLDQRIIDASIELAAAMASGYDAVNSSSTASGIKRQKAGSVEQEFFAAGTGGAAESLRFPLPVWELIRGLLAGQGGALIGGSLASGTCGESVTEIPFGYFGYGSLSRDYD